MAAKVVKNALFTRILETETGVGDGAADESLPHDDDFLTEHCYVLFEVRFEEPGMTFFFGQAGSVAKVQDLLEKFSNSLGA